MLGIYFLNIFYVKYNGEKENLKKDVMADANIEKFLSQFVDNDDICAYICFLIP